MTTPKAAKNCDSILNIIKDFIKTNGYSPTARDIVNKSSLKSVSSVHGYIIELERRGLIIREDNKSRSIKLAQSETHSLSVTLPVVGNIAAGSPILAEENIVDNVDIPSDLAGKGSFILEVHGDSMIDAGIYDGDKIVVKAQKTVKNGDIAVVIIDDEATVKCFFKEKTRVRLQPKNKKYKNIYVKKCQVVGKVIGLYRTMK